jgi:hypothetical protein
VALGLAERLDLWRIGLALLVHLVGLAVTDLADDFVAGGPTSQLFQKGATVAERPLHAGEGDHVLGASREATVEAEEVIDGVAAQAAMTAEEVGTEQTDGADGSQEFTGACALVAAGLSARTGAGRTPFFSESSI